MRMIRLIKILLFSSQNRSVSKANGYFVVLIDARKMHKMKRTQELPLKSFLVL